MSLPLDPNTILQQAVGASRDCPATAATATYVLVTALRTIRVDRVELSVDATYAADTTNFYAFTLVWGAGLTVAASWSTQTSAQGAITATVPAVMVLSATDANLVIAAGSVIKLIATKAASAANITPRVVLYGRAVG